MPAALATWTLSPLLRLARTLAWLAFAAALVFGGLLVLPMAVDWQAHRPRLVELLAEATGRPVSIDGPIDLALLPGPAISLGDVKVGNPPGTAAAYLLEARRVSARLSWHALLQGRIEVTRIALDAPRVVIEPAPDGHPNWWLPLLDSPGRDGPPLLPLSVDRVEVRHGRLVHATGLVGQPIDAGAIDLVVRLDGNAKRVRVDGSAMANGVPVRIAIDLHTATSAEPPLIFSFDAPGGRLAFAGWNGQRSAEDPLRGNVRIAAPALPEFVESVSRLLGRPPLRLNGAVLGAFDGSGDIVLAGDRLAIDGLDVRIGSEVLRGKLQVSWSDGIDVGGHLAATTIDADRWIERLRDQPLLAPAAGAASPGEPPALRLQLAASVARVHYRRDTVRDLSVRFRLEGDTIHLRELAATLPGDFRVYRKVGFEGDQDHPGYDGMIEVEARDLRRTLKWIGIDTASVPADRLRTFRLQGRTRPVKGIVHVSDATFVLDDQPGTLSADVALLLPTVISARLHMPRLDLDAYRLGPAAFQAMAAPATTPAGDGPEIAPPLFDVEATVDQVLYRGEPAHAVDAHVLVRGNLLTLKHVGVGALLGAHLEISGSVNDFGTAPHLDLAWRGTLPDADRMLDYAGLPRFVHGRIGAAQLTGKAKGSLRTITLSELSLSMLGATITASGDVSFADGLRYDFPRWTLTTPDIGALAAVASGDRRRSLAEVRANGAFRGDQHQASFHGDLEVDGMPLSATLSSTLTGRPRIAATLRAATGLRLDRWLPAAPGTGAAHAVHAWASQPIPAPDTGLAALRGFDGTLALETPEIRWGPYAMVGVGIAARLQQGVLHVERLSGRLEGAGIHLAGTVDARRPRTLLEVRGSLRDIDISRTIAVAHTANDFGSDDLAVALEGRLALEDLVLRSEGGSFQDLLLTANASGRTEGQVHPVVTRGSLSLATLATGIGSLFSSEMGFASAVIDSFVNRWIATRGTFELADGVLTLHEHTLRVPDATAYVTSRIDARQGLLDTAILLDIGTPGSIDYTMSLRGPMRAPALRAEPNRGR